MDVFTDDNGDEFIVGGILPEEDDVVPMCLEDEDSFEFPDDDEDMPDEEQLDEDGHIIACSSAPPPPALPEAVDLRKYCSNVDNQINTNTCVAHAVNGAVEIMSNLYAQNEGKKIESRGAFVDISPLFIYYNAKKTHTKDTGISIWAAIDALRRHGACSEKAWSFAKSRVLQKPPPEAYQEAAKRKLKGFRNVPVDLNQFKRLLAAGHPIITGLMLPKKFYAPRYPGIVEWGKGAMYNPGGGHGMLIVGYNDKRNAFLYRNSWGSGRGDRGYFWVDYRYTANKNYNKLGNYVLLSIAGFDFVPKPSTVEVDDLHTLGISIKVLGIKDKKFYFDRDCVPNLDENERGEIRGLTNLRTGEKVDIMVWGKREGGQEHGDSYGSPLADTEVNEGDVLTSGGMRPQVLFDFQDCDAGSAKLHGKMQLCTAGVFCKVGDRVVASWANNHQWYSGSIKRIHNSRSCDIDPDNGIDNSNRAGWSNVPPDRVVKSSDDGSKKKWAWKIPQASRIPNTFSTEPIDGFEVNATTDSIPCCIRCEADPENSWADMIVESAGGTTCKIKACVQTRAAGSFNVWFDDGAKYKWQVNARGRGWELCPKEFELDEGRHILHIGGNQCGRIFQVAIAKGAAEFVSDEPEISAAGVCINVSKVDDESGSVGRFFQCDAGDIPSLSGGVSSGVIRELVNSRTGCTVDVKICRRDGGNACGRLLLGSGEKQFEVGDILKPENAPDVKITGVDPAPNDDGPDPQFGCDLSIARLKKIEDFQYFHLSGNLKRLHGSIVLNESEDYVSVPNGSVHSSKIQDSWVEFAIYAKESTTVKVQGLIKSPSDKDDSFNIWVDDGDKFAWHTGVHKNWTKVTCSKSFHLSAGRHVLRVGGREDGTMLKALEIVEGSSSVGFLYYPQRTTENFENWQDDGVFKLNGKMRFFSNDDGSDTVPYIYQEGGKGGRDEEGICKVDDRIVWQFENGLWYSGRVFAIHNENSCDVFPDDGRKSSNIRGASNVTPQRVYKSSDDGSRKKWCWRVRSRGQIPRTYSVVQCTGFQTNEASKDAMDSWLELVVEVAKPTSVAFKACLRSSADAVYNVWFDKGEKFEWKVGKTSSFTWVDCPQKFELSEGSHVMCIGTSSDATHMSQVSFTAQHVGFVDRKVVAARKAKSLGSVKDTFQKFDADKSGSISEDELSAVLADLMPNTPPEQLKHMFKVADVNKDGSISYEEFLNWLTSDGV